MFINLKAIYPASIGSYDTLKRFIIRIHGERLINVFDGADIAALWHYEARQAPFPVIVALFEPPEQRIWQFRTASSSCHQPSSHEE